MPNVKPRETSQAVDQELEGLPHALIRDLRKRWKELFASDPPKAFGPDLLRRAIAQRIQEQAYGGLEPAVRRELKLIIKLHGSKTNGRTELPRRIGAGAVVLREWKGATHRVTVLSNGFSYNQQIYQSLSEVARAITGTRWNGPRFFGLRKPDVAKTTGTSPAGSARARPGRPHASDIAARQTLHLEPSHEA